MTAHITQHRDLSQTVGSLRGHVQRQIDALPELAERFKLGPDSVQELEAYLRDELTYLEGGSAKPF